MLYTYLLDVLILMNLFLSLSSVLDMRFLSEWNLHITYANNIT